MANELPDILTDVRTDLDTISGLTVLSTAPDSITAYPTALVYSGDTGGFHRPIYAGGILVQFIVGIEIYVARRITSASEILARSWPQTVADVIFLSGGATYEAAFYIEELTFEITRIEYASDEPHYGVVFQMPVRLQQVFARHA